MGTPIEPSHISAENEDTSTVVFGLIGWASMTTCSFNAVNVAWNSFRNSLTSFPMYPNSITSLFNFALVEPMRSVI